MIAEITTGDYPKRANRGKRSRFGPAERVLSIAFADDLSLQSARQVEGAREHAARIDLPLARIAIPLVPARVVSGIIPMFVVGRLPRIATRPSTQLASVVVVARTDVGLPPVVISIVVMGGAAAGRSGFSSYRGVSVRIGGRSGGGRGGGRSGGLAEELLR